MSVSRKDWSALSSLARQRTLEDEEEQERERRRRRRNLSSTTDDESPKLTQNGARRSVERLPSVEEAETPKPSPPVSKDEEEDFQAILRTRKERRQRRQVVEAAQAPVQERLEAEGEKDSPGPEQTLTQPLVPKRKVEALPRRRLSQEQRGPWAREEENIKSRELEGAAERGLPEEAVVQQKTLVSEKSPVPEKTPVPAKRLASEKACPSEKGVATDTASQPEKKRSPEKLVPERTSASEKSPVPVKTLVSLKTAAPERRSTPVLEKAVVFEKMQERRLVSEKASLFEKSLVSETKLTPKKATAEQPQAPGGSQVTAREPRGRAVPGKSPPSSAEQGTSDAPTKAPCFPPITLQVKIPSKDEEADIPSPTLLTYSSSLKRSSPRTISFRMSPRKDNSETTLTRSASVRLPASTVKLGEKLERYHTAIQRSESVRSPGSSRTEVLVAPAGVASRRHLFEKELAGQNRTEPTIRKENLRLSGVVTSRLNLWISKTQDFGDQGPQDTQKETSVTRRAQWGSKPAMSLDAEV
ncbi:ladinin-1 [Phodopus roborovskii]|uniref:ladinin-1 n=1 Tax=Phodopus roborovskii TaxID=109678 RepID=UPI0021E4B83E|nr:ladinin-1 [Phodopus roborovskii]